VLFNKTNKVSSRGNGVTAENILKAVETSMAVIEFKPDGSIITANESFLSVVGYSLAEVAGQHHRMFIEADYAQSSDYRQFWEALRAGKPQKGEFKRLNKAGRQVWLEASYCPVFDDSGRVASVTKFAFDITDKKNEVTRLLTMIDGMPVAVMTVDPKNDFKINYLNETSKKTLKSIEQFLPIKVDQMLGSSVDVFHKNPEHQRRMLTTDAMLPFSTKIRIGPEVLRLQITAIKDSFGAYIGPMLTWAVITAQETVASEVTSVADALLASSMSMSDSSQGLRDAAENASQQAASAAAGAEQMSSAIHEIVTQVTRVSDRASEIASQAQSMDDRVKALADNASQVDSVVALIKDIAAQTNLLALNATIEAARAGEAGRGFAVVASEVKALASQTSKATDEITQQVLAIQTSSHEAVKSVEEISNAVAELSGLTTSMAGAMEEQAATTQQMSSNIGNVSHSATETGTLASSVQETASGLSGHAERMKTSIQGLLKAG
jgi:methyl-accepting chemotaxis protein